MREGLIGAPSGRRPAVVDDPRKNLERARSASRVVRRRGRAAGVPVEKSPSPTPSTCRPQTDLKCKPSVAVPVAYPWSVLV